jgi:integral membrane protein
MDRVDRFRSVAFWEGISFLLLLFLAMPLKYWAGWPLAVRVVGMAHGLLFLAYLVFLARAAALLGSRNVVLALAVSVIPGATFWLDARLRRAFPALGRAGTR